MFLFKSALKSVTWRCGRTNSRHLTVMSLKLQLKIKEWLDGAAAWKRQKPQSIYTFSVDGKPDIQPLIHPLWAGSCLYVWPTGSNEGSCSPGAGGLMVSCSWALTGQMLLGWNFTLRPKAEGHTWSCTANFFVAVVTKHRKTMGERESPELFEKREADSYPMILSVTNGRLNWKR